MSKRRKESDAIDLPTTVQGYKKSEKYIIDSLLTPYDWVPDNIKVVGLFRAEDPVYLRKDIFRLNSASTWRYSHMRQIMKDQKPLRVISRNVGGIQRTIELFSCEQTEPLAHLIASKEAGIPVNDFGNVEYDRIPENCGVIETNDITSLIRICKTMKDLRWCRCQNGWRRRQPNYIGVVVLKEDADLVRGALHASASASAAAEERSRNEAAMAIWRVLIQRIKAEYYIKTVIDKK
jgi:hypothetical protein